MPYEEYLPFAGYITSLIALAYAIFMFRNNLILKNKYSLVMDAEKEAKRIIGDAEEEKKSISNEIVRMKADYTDKKVIYSALLIKIDEIEEKIESDDAGFRDIQFEFDDPEDYKAAIESVRNEQKFLVKSKLAATCSQSWKVNGSLREGSRMVNESIKITMRAFNSECDVIIGNVNWKNIKQSQQNIQKVFYFYNNYNKINDILISKIYFDLKLKELELAFQNKERKQAIKEEQREIRERIREEERFEKDRLAAQKDEEKYQNLLKKAQEEAAKATGDKLVYLQEEIKLLQISLKEAEEKNQRAISMAQQTKSGHVYIISNIGSFGEDVFKIGMTRRLDPYERVSELGDASVPFGFDVHAMISCENAPELEAKFHSTFERNKMNLINNRREFFKVHLDDIEKEIKKDRPDALFIRTALAEQYRKSEALRAQFSNDTSEIHRDEFPDSL